MKPEKAIAESDLKGDVKKEESEVNGTKEDRLVVGVDFGTTYSG